MEELIFNVIDCENATISTPDGDPDTGGLIAEMQESPQTGSTHFQKYTIDFSRNCCSEETIKIPVFYDFVKSFVACENDDENDRFLYTFRITGINPLFITGLEISKDGGVTFTNQPYSNYTGNTGFNYIVNYPTSAVTIPNAPFPNPPNTQDYNYVLRITHMDGFVYVLSLRFTLTQPGECSLSNPLIVNVVYPEIDERINFISNTINLLSLFGLEEALVTGIYEVIICRWYLSNPLTITSLSTTCVQNNYFVDCGIICDLINKLIDCKDTNIFTFYDALVAANNCDTSYEDMCALYEMIVTKLENPDCRDPFDDCNCSKNCNDNLFKPRPFNTHKAPKPSCGSCK